MIYQNLTRWFNCIAVHYAGTLDEVVAYVGKRGIGKSPALSLKEKIHDLTENTPGTEISARCKNWGGLPSFCPRA